MNGNQRNRVYAKENGSNKNAAPASCIGFPFHNPYTFIPFPVQCAKRKKPSLLTIDETEQDRQSGILEVEVTTISPLLCCSPVPLEDPKTKHKTFKALTIDNDVVMPATGIRGALRTLMTIITGGTLGYMDEDLWLCQGRDAQLGPSFRPGIPKNPFLAEVIEPGNSIRPGRIQLGTTKLIELSKLIKLFHSEEEVDNKRGPQKDGRIVHLWIDDPDNPQRLGLVRTCECQWKAKLSGIKVNSRGLLREGAVLLDGPVIELPDSFWRVYQGRNRHSVRPELKKGDLIWLEPDDPECKKINSASDIRSIQWARWGRKGIAFKDLLPQHAKPDSFNRDGFVDCVTDLFGQVPMDEEGKAAGPFAARIRPHNLIFFDAKNKLIPGVTLAPLSSPHPGCRAFYRDCDDLDVLNKNSPLKGYKVYRNTREHGETAPWHYRVQGIYDKQGKLETSEKQKINITADLLKEKVTGKLRIAFRALDKTEMALLLTTCSLDWKLGGGKPLGLGHCRVTSIKVLDEEGNMVRQFSRDPNSEEPMQLPAEIASLVCEFVPRIRLYQESQRPVDKLRYPRLVKPNGNRNTRGGHAWFSTFAVPKKSGKNNQDPVGLSTVWTKDNLRRKAEGKTQIRAQALPPLNIENPKADQLYGYDCICPPEKCEKLKDNRILYGDFEQFDESAHHHAIGISGGNTSQNRETREAQRQLRGEQPVPMPTASPSVIVNHKVNDIIEAILLPEKTNKGGWKVRSIDSAISGAIQNNQEVHADKKAGDKVKVMIKILKGNVSGFWFIQGSENGFL